MYKKTEPQTQCNPGNVLARMREALSKDCPREGTCAGQMRSGSSTLDVPGHWPRAAWERKAGGNPAAGLEGAAIRSSGPMGSLQGTSDWCSSVAAMLTSWGRVLPGVDKSIPYIGRGPPPLPQHRPPPPTPRPGSPSTWPAPLFPLQGGTAVSAQRQCRQPGWNSLAQGRALALRLAPHHPRSQRNPMSTS